MASLKLPMVLLAGMLISAPALRGEDMLPPPPPGDDMMMPPPPGGDMLPPPGGDMMAPPPPGGDMMAPPGGDMFAPPPPGGDMMAPPPPGGDMMAPPPGGDMMAPPGGDMMAPPPGGDMMAPPGDLAPPPGDEMFPEPAPVASSSSGKPTSYRVVRGDSLWRISGKDRIYGDSFQWPLLFIANRDRIKDPDIIQPSWNLKVRRNLGADEIASAVEKAKDTPRYEPHTAPRRRLPIDY